MLKRLLHLLKPQAWLLAVLIITAALPARAQDAEEVEIQEGQFKFEYSNDLNGYIISPNRYSGWEWDRSDVVFISVPSTRLRDGLPVVGLSGFESLKYLDFIEFESPCHVKYICDNCFEYCTSLGTSEGITLPSTVETIGHSAFYGCTNLQVVNLSSNLKSIGKEAFKRCSQLGSITLPNSLKEIREYAFQECTGLTEVTFEDGVDFYADNYYYYGFCNNVFWGCSNLSKVTLPSNTPGRFVIPAGTFGYCSKLRSIKFPPNTGKIE